MTSALVSQVGVEALYKVTPAVRVSHAGIEYLHTVTPGVRVSQSGVEILHRVTPGFFVSSAGVEVLHKSVPCGTRWALIVSITRSDGETYRFTSKDGGLEWPPGSGTTYQSCDSLAPSASENVAELESSGSMDLSGAFGAIDEHDLYAGLFDGATLEVWLVDWDEAAIARRQLKGTFGPVEQTDTGFKVELLGDGQKLQQTPLVRTLQPGCRWVFGSAQCGKDLGPLIVTGTIDSAIGQREFSDAARGEVAGYFKRGVVTFTSGDNDGQSAEIKEHEAGGHFILWPRLPFAIAAGDAYLMTPGCTLLKESADGTNGCEAWANFDNYGGFRSVPTRDQMSTTADAKE